MADGKKPAPLCIYSGASGIDAGTLARVCSAAPGHVGSPVSGRGSAVWLIVRATDIERAQMAVLRSVPKLPSEVRAAVVGLMTPKALATMGGAAAIYAASHGTGFGELFDLIAAGVAIGFLGKDALEVGSRFHSFWVRATTAQDEADLDAAAGYFASAISIVGIDVLLAFLARSSSGRGSAGARASRIEVQLQEALDRRDWQQVQKALAAIADDLSRGLALPHGTSVFYSGGLGAEATRWARLNGRFTIDMTKAGKTLLEVTEPLKGRFRWVEDIRPAWARLSERLATQAGGEVHAFVRGRKTVRLEIAPNEVRVPRSPTGVERRGVVRGAGSVFWEIEYPEMALQPLRANPKVTQIIFHVCDDVGREIETVTELTRP